jgi:hypothetical protein
LVGIVRERREREREDKAAWYGRREWLQNKLKGIWYHMAASSTNGIWEVGKAN